MDLDIDIAGSTSLFFEPLLLKRLIGEFCCAPYWTGDISYDRDSGRNGCLVEGNGSLALWTNLRDGRPASAEYVFGIDVSAGTGATPTCLSILNRMTGEKVGEYANAHIDPKQMGYVVVALAWLFKSEEGEPARVCWEQQGPGLTMGGKILELGLRNVYFTARELPRSFDTKISDRPGWVPTKDTILTLLTDYRSAICMRQFINRSELALKECLQFKYSADGFVEHAHIQSANDPTGARVNHGDRVIADALAWKMCEGGTLGMPVLKVPDKPLTPTALAWRRQFADNEKRRLATY